MRLQRFIALSTHFSRRKAENLIKDGRITVNTNKITKLGTKVDPKKDIVRIDGNKIEPKKEKIYLILHKPSGYISTRKDTHGRKTILELVPYKEVYPVGRLDKNTEGLILLTNDGEFAYKVTHPKFEHKKEYEVVTKSKLTKLNKQKLEKGIIIDSKKTAKSKITQIKKSAKIYSCHITIHEGRKRQIRKMFEKIGNPVIYLKRIRIGKVLLGNLKKGQFSHLKQFEINSFK